MKQRVLILGYGEMGYGNDKISETLTIAFGS